MSTPSLLATLAPPRMISAEWGSLLARCLISGEKLFDLIAIVAGLYAADALRLAMRSDAALWPSGSTEFLCASGFALLFVFLLERHGGYRPCLSLLGIRETERVLRVSLQTFSAALVVAYLCHAGVPRTSIAFAAALVPLFLTLEKWQVHRFLVSLRSRGYGTRRAIIVGTGSTARRIYTALVNSPKLGVEPVAFVEEDASTTTTEIYECSYRRRHCARVLPGPLTPEMCRQLGASVLVIAEPAWDSKDAAPDCSDLAKAGVDTYFTREDFADTGSWVDYAEIDGIMLGHLARESPRALYEICKRALDVFTAIVGLLLLAPIAPVIAALIKKTSPGPVFFRQARVGKAGRRFEMYKFRTMFVDAPQFSYSPGQVDDPRVTPIGRFLRRTSLDEVPQVINVLLGHMSMVGPRPEMQFIADNYNALQRQRLSVKPGVTGLWQISGDRAYLIHENIECDLYCLANNPAFVWRVSLQLAGLRSFEMNNCCAGSEVDVL